MAGVVEEEGEVVVVIGDDGWSGAGEELADVEEGVG